MKREELEQLRSGDIIHIGPGCGCAIRHMYAEFVRLNRWTAWDGMAWLDVREVDGAGDQWPAIEKVRMAYVAIAGLRLVRKSGARAMSQRRRPANAGPAAVPRPRTAPESIPGRTR